jgi:hypothetical protein
VISENTTLGCDLKCEVQNGPCIQFVRDHIKLRLNGYKITGPAVPPTDCAPNSSNANPYDGVASVGFDHNEILGPGLIQRFRRHGIFLANGSNLRVRHVTSNHNCFSGLLTNGVTESDIEENVSIRNAIASRATPCGGNCLVASHRNRVRRNEYHANGSIISADPNNPLGAPSNDFGVGLVFGSSDNVTRRTASPAT